MHVLAQLTMSYDASVQSGPWSCRELQQLRCVKLLHIMLQKCCCFMARLHVLSHHMYTRLIREVVWLNPGTGATNSVVKGRSTGTAVAGRLPCAQPGREWASACLSGQCSVVSEAQGCPRCCAKVRTSAQSQHKQLCSEFLFALLIGCYACPFLRRAWM